MLFTDAEIVTQADLLRVESGLLEIASQSDADIDLDDHIAFCRDEFSDWLMKKCQAFSGYNTVASLSALPTVALITSITEATSRPRISLSQICVTNSEYPGKWSPLKRLLVYQTIYKFFRNASRRRDVDKYEEKWADYEKECTHEHQPSLQRTGVGVVVMPFPAPGAILEYGAGTFSASNLSRLLDTARDTDDPEFDVVVTWVDNRVFQSAAVPANGESGPSVRATIKMHAGDQIIVSIDGLTAPNGTFRPSAVAGLPVTPMITSGWNVYAGPKNGTLTLQTPTPIAYATKTKTLDASLLTTGTPVGYGQFANYLVPLPNLLMRG